LFDVPTVGGSTIQSNDIEDVYEKTSAKQKHVMCKMNPEMPCCRISKNNRQQAQDF
jgi:hypothetical protein